MKEILLLVLSMAMLVCATPHMAFAANNIINVNGLTYELTSDEAQKTAVLTKGDGAMGEVVIPDTVYYAGNSYIVKSIGYHAFYECENLTSVTIPDSVTTIGELAFVWCRNLTSVTIPDSVTTIGDGAFEWCGNLTSVTIPDSVTTIGRGTFRSCSSLMSITIPHGVTTIGENAFYDCSILTSLTIPDSVTAIGKGAFGWCTRLASINVGANNQNFESRDGVLFDKGGKKLILCPVDKTAGYTIPDSVTSIEGGAFQSCVGLTSVTIPYGVTTIGKSAFEGCVSLESVTIPSSVESIGYHAFICCNLTSITIAHNFDRSKFISTGIIVGNNNTFKHYNGTPGSFVLV